MLDIGARLRDIDHALINWLAMSAIWNRSCAACSTAARWSTAPSCRRSRCCLPRAASTPCARAVEHARTSRQPALRTAAGRGRPAGRLPRHALPGRARLQPRPARQPRPCHDDLAERPRRPGRDRLLGTPERRTARLDPCFRRALPRGQARHFLAFADPDADPAAAREAGVEIDGELDVRLGGRSERLRQ